jgi:RimJ/RimL family protein N-acetyltransferase
MSTAVPDFSIKPTLAGDLVTLRPVGEPDVEGLRDLVSDPVGNRLTGSHGEVDEAKLRWWYATRAEHADRLDLAVIDRATGSYAGEVVLNDLDLPNQACSFRIALRPGFQDRGLGTEATRLILGHAFETVGLHRISLEVYAFNPRARAVYERVGFVAEGVLRDALCWDGEFVDATVMSVLGPEWARHRGRPEPRTDRPGEAVIGR